MHGLSKKLLTILLSLLLGLAPLQGAFAGFSSDCDHESGMHQSVDSQADTMTLVTQQMNHDCPHCNTVADCPGQCSSIQSVFAALLPDTSNTVKTIALPAPPTVLNSILSQIPALLFRPPRG